MILKHPIWHTQAMIPSCVSPSAKAIPIPVVSLGLIYKHTAITAQLEPAQQQHQSHSSEITEEPARFSRCLPRPHTITRELCCRVRTSDVISPEAKLALLVMLVNRVCEPSAATSRQLVPAIVLLVYDNRCAALTQCKGQMFGVLNFEADFDSGLCHLIHSSHQ